MCFVAGWLTTGSDPGLTVATNRDEFYDRQGEEPSLHRDGPYDVISPRDPRKGGTWIGINETGFFVALTNKLDTNEIEDAPSRGRLVRSLLEESSNRESAMEAYEHLGPSRFNPFWLILVDREGLTVVRHDLDGDEFTERGGGVFLLSNESGFRHDTKDVRSALPELKGSDTGDDMETLGAFCRSHEPLLEREARCLHAGIAGTLSSSLIRMNARDDPAYRFAQGPPCETDYRSIEVSDSFRDNVRAGWGGQPSTVTDS